MPLQSTAEPPPVKLSLESWQAVRWVVGYLGPYKWRFIFALIVQFCSTLLGLVFPYASGELIDAALGRSSAGSINAVAGVLFAVLALQAICSFTATINFLTAVERAVADVRQAVYTRLICLPMRFFAQRRVGELAGRIAGDLSKIEDTLGETVPHFIRQTVNLAGGVVLISLTSIKLAGIMLVSVPPVMILAVVFGKRLRELSKESQDRLADTNVIVEETLQGVATVKAFGNEWFEVARYRRGLDAFVRVAIKLAWGYAFFFAFIIFALFGGMVLVVWSGAHMVETGTLSPGELARFVLYTAFVAGAVGSFAEVFGQLQQALGATERVREILREEPEPVSHARPDGAIARVAAAVQLADVHFRYPSRPEVAVLNGLSLTAEPGQTIALVGPSGAGKSTTVALLLRFHDPDSGTITIGGRPIGDYSLPELRANIAIVPQDVLLFGGTIAENIGYGKPGATLREIESAARRAHAHEFITTFPDGYQTKVGERGVQLSGGQRQRLAIARAILRDPVLLILDEATSSLDAESERLVREALDELLPGRTAIVIAHRLATVRRADCIFVIDGGRVVQSGRHDELLAQDGLYQSLARLQFTDGH
jgi:ATP-binding cassette subfamily B protein